MVVDVVVVVVVFVVVFVIDDKERTLSIQYNLL